MTTLLLSLVIAQASANPPPPVQVPFGCGRSYPVSQAHDTGSHKHNDTWAWDFRMPEGVPIVAAADGVVRLARGDSKVGGCDMKYARHANYVVLAHADGYETQYLHFSEVVVEPGQRVKAGQLIGFSGNTGWSCGSHLHFKVATTERDSWNNPSVPAELVGYGDPQKGTLVAAPRCEEQLEVLQARATPADLTPGGESLGGSIGSGEGASTTGTGATEPGPTGANAASRL